MELKSEKIIYVQLLNEGSVAYRPVLSFTKDNIIFKVVSIGIYEKEDEEWEFAPGENVLVEERYLDGSKVLVAISNYVKK